MRRTRSRGDHRLTQMHHDQVVRAASRRAAFALALLALVVSAALAQDVTPTQTGTSDGWSGQLGVSYGVALSSGGAAPVTGPIVRADLSFRAGERHLTFRSDPLSLSRLNVAFELRERSDLLSITLAREPADGSVPQRGDRSDVQVLALRRAAAGPTLQALVNAQHVAGAGGSSTVVTRLALNDRLASPGFGLSSLDWRSALQLQQVDVPAAGLSRRTTTASFGVGAAFGGDDGRRWRPSAALDLSAERGGSASDRARLDLGLAGALTSHEQLSVRLRWDLERSEGAAPRLAQQQRVALTSARLTPLRLGVEGDRRVNLAGESAWGWGVNVDTSLAAGWTLGGSYRGALDERGSEHGLSGRFGVQHASPGATLRVGVEFGARWRDADGWQPSASISASAARRGDGPLSAQASLSLRYADTWAGTAGADGRVTFDWGDLSASVEVTVAEAITLGGGAVLAVQVVDAVAAQLGVSARSTLGGATSAALDLGARYTFGGR